MNQWSLKKMEKNYVKSAALSCWWKRKCASLHFAFSLNMLALYVISFVGALPFFLTVPSPPNNDQKCLSLHYLVSKFQQRQMTFQKQMIHLLRMHPEQLTQNMVLFSCTALNPCCSSCGTLVRLGCFSPSPLKTTF